jgi:cytoskeletal protein CcmA (bactofilin family)
VILFLLKGKSILVTILMLPASHYPSKTLTFPEPTEVQIKQSNVPTEINVPTAHIDILTSSRIHLSDNIYSPEASVSSIDIYYDPSTQVTYLHNTSKNLSIKMDSSGDALKIFENGDVQFSQNLEVAGTVQMSNCRVDGSLEADKIDVLGDVTATRITAETELVTSGSLVAENARITGDALVDGAILTRGIVAENIEASLVLKTPLLQTVLINSPVDINIAAGPGSAVNIPNVRNNVSMSDLGTITPEMMKTAKVFVVNKNILLQADPSCNGIEIVIYNQNTATIIVRDITRVLAEIECQHAAKFIFIGPVNRWAKI